MQLWRGTEQIRWTAEADVGPGGVCGPREKAPLPQPRPPQAEPAPPPSAAWSLPPELLTAILLHSRL